MNREHSEIIRDSWRRLEDRHDRLAAVFYERLFALDATVKDLFAVTDMGSQRGKFVTMIDEMLRLAPEPEAFESALRASGARHREYGVVSRHYRIVGEALLIALDVTVEGGLDDETREAWAAAYTHMAHLMQCGADEG